MLDVFLFIVVFFPLSWAEQTWKMCKTIPFAVQMLLGAFGVALRWVRFTYTGTVIVKLFILQYSIHCRMGLALLHEYLCVCIFFPYIPFCLIEPFHFTNDKS